MKNNNDRGYIEKKIYYYCKVFYNLGQFFPLTIEFD